MEKAFYFDHRFDRAIAQLEPTKVRSLSPQSLPVDSLLFDYAKRSTKGSRRVDVGERSLNSTKGNQSSVLR
ncbi:MULTISPECIES: hypothetical protein [unclassified Coleofasciculus]|uniref:hypothetical protein n=1 Tax=unclassified Coleofasciculus TaxID=2692782 RepID=UPI00187E365A|nr:MULTISPECIES: hypothetical protein [unclassified Coleofasciculus]MBE9126082.1 hypothetical protein [Coleofasciculus sp. LEGE 07081]MBE9149496.1 hypothetical protein [Coleofasciculus sp. LEGE 07092]